MWIPRSTPSGDSLFRPRRLRSSRIQTVASFAYFTTFIFSTLIYICLCVCLRVYIMFISNFLYHVYAMNKDENIDNIAVFFIINGVMHAFVSKLTITLIQ